MDEPFQEASKFLFGKYMKEALESDLRDWTELTRQIVASGEYPLIDSEELDVWNQIWDVWPNSVVPALELLENYAACHYGDIAARFVALNFAFRLLHHEGIEKEEVVLEERRAVKECLARLVRVQDVEGIHDARALRWEIVNACAIEDWDRSLQLCDLLRPVASCSEGEFRAVRGQFRVLRVESERDPVAFLGWWRPVIETEFSWRSLSLLLWGLSLSQSNEFTNQQTYQLRDAAHDLEIALSELSVMSSSYHAVVARCYFIQEDYVRSAAHFERLLKRGLGLGAGEMVSNLKELLYDDAARANELCGQSDKAEELLRACLTEFPRSKGKWLRLAKLQTQPPKADYKAAFESLRRKVENYPASGEDLSVSVALALGAAAGRGQIGEDTLNKYVESHPELVRPIEATIEAHWRAFDELTESSRREWLFGALIMWVLEVPDQLRSSLYKAATLKFGSVVETELATRVFGPFRSLVARAGDLMALAEQGLHTQQGEKFCGFLTCRRPFTLGDTLFELNACQHASDPIRKEFRHWLQKEHPRLTKNFWSLRCPRINDLRNRAAHPGDSVSKQETDEMYALCRRFLSTILPEAADSA